MSDADGSFATAPEPPSQPVAAPPTVEAADVGRTIGRALEHERPAVPVDTDEVLTAVARELDVDPRHLALAVVEERTIGDGGWTTRLVGPATVAVHRNITGREIDTTEALADDAEVWLERGHGLRVVAVDDGSIEAVRRTDTLGKISTSLRAAGGVGRLGRFRRTRVFTAVVDTSAAVAVEVDLIDQRGKSLLGGLVAGTVALGVVGAGTVLLSPFAAAAAPVAVAIGGVTARRNFGKHRELAEIEAAEMADGLARGQRPPRLRDEVEARLRGRSRRTIVDRRS